MDGRELPVQTKTVKKTKKKITRFIEEEDIEKWSIKRLINDIYDDE